MAISGAWRWRGAGTEPQLLLLDEPTAGMNPNETASMMRLIDRLRWNAV